MSGKRERRKGEIGSGRMVYLIMGMSMTMVKGRRMQQIRWLHHLRIMYNNIYSTQRQKIESRYVTKVDRLR